MVMSVLRPQSYLIHFISLYRSFAAHELPGTRLPILQ